MGIQDRFYGELETAYHTHAKSTKVESKWEKANPKGEVLDRLNRNTVMVEKDPEVVFLDDVLKQMKPQPQVAES